MSSNSDKVKNRHSLRPDIGISTNTMNTVNTLSSRPPPLPPNLVSTNRKQQIQETYNERIRRKVEGQNSETSLNRKSFTSRPPSQKERNSRSTHHTRAPPKPHDRSDNLYQSKIRKKIESRSENLRESETALEDNANSPVSRKLKDFTYITENGEMDSFELRLEERKPKSQKFSQRSHENLNVTSLETVSTEDTQNSNQSPRTHPQATLKHQKSINHKKTETPVIEAYVVDDVVPLVVAKETKTGCHKQKSSILVGFFIAIGISIGMYFGTIVKPAKVPQITKNSQKYFQTYSGTDLSILNDAQKETLENNFEDYTKYFGEPISVDTVSTVHHQVIIGSRALRGMSSENNTSQRLRVDFTMTYASSVVDVTAYPKLFQDFLNSNEGQSLTLSDLQSVGVAVEASDFLYFENDPTPSPTTSIPTFSPSSSPTFSPFEQLGSNLVSPETNAWYGDSVSISKECKRVAIGAPKSGAISVSTNSALFESGLVEIYDNNGNEWIKIGHIYGENNQDWLGRSVSLTANGNFLAIGAPKHDKQPTLDMGAVQNAGFVRIYKISQELLSMHGQTIYGQGESSMFGGHVSLSDNGMRLAVGSNSYAKVFEFNEKTNTWDQLGNNIGGVDYSRVSLSRDGAYVAVSFRYADQETENDGLVQVWQYSSNAYAFIQVGQNLVGIGNDHRFGADLSMSYNGKIIAIGTEGGNYVQIYSLNEELKRWIQMGDNIKGDDKDGGKFNIFGHRLSLSSDGYTLAISSPNYGYGDNEYAGRVAIYKFDQTDGWKKFRNDIKGAGKNLRTGKDVSISPNAQCVTVGTPEKDGSGIASVFLLQ